MSIKEFKKFWNRTGLNETWIYFAPLVVVLIAWFFFG